MAVTCFCCDRLLDEEEEAKSVTAARRTIIDATHYRIDYVTICTSGCAQGFFDCDKHSASALGWSPWSDEACKGRTELHGPEARDDEP